MIMPNHQSPLIVMGCDERYCFPLAAAMFSALSSAKTPLRVVILSDRISAESKAVLAEVAQRGGAKSFQIVDVDIKAFSQHDRGSAHLSVAAFSRLLISTLLPEENRCLWVDSDVLVCRDLGELWNVDLQGKTVGAVQCYYVPNVGNPHGIPYVKEASDLPEVPYFNSGIMVLDLDAWRRAGIDSQIQSFLNEFGNRLNAADQDVLNGVFLNRWQPLPGYWNDQEAANRKANPAGEMIRHFSGPQKPWNSGLFDSDCKNWLRCAKRSGYYPPLRFAWWRLQRLRKVLRGTTTNFVKRRGWMR